MANECILVADGDRGIVKATLRDYKVLPHSRLRPWKALILCRFLHSLRLRL